MTNLLYIIAYLTLIGVVLLGVFVVHAITTERPLPTDPEPAVRKVE